MDKNLLVTTTNTVENAKIERYIEVISTNVVIGTNFFSDFGASLTDIFGGYSETYQNKLQSIYAIAIDNLKKKAKKLGANSIVGLKIDFDEISGKGKSMFMISAIGTAVVVKYVPTHTEKIKTTDISESFVSNNDLKDEVTKRIIYRKRNMDKLPSQEEWVYLMSNPQKDFVSYMLKNYLVTHSEWDDKISDEEKLLFENFPSYLSLIDEDFVVELLYSNIQGNHKAVYNILERNRLFAASKIFELIKTGEVKIGIKCLGLEKLNYTKDDLLKMKEILFHFESLPNIGRIETVKSLIGKTKDVYICPNGHSNKIDEMFCKHSSESILDCNLNIKGLTEEQFSQIELLKLRVESLSDIIK